ncbi:hypothetical protein I6B53_05415 [Schaalia sp. 19OD2882]|uniref:hypothetical protein n=1 Tax=Schaalia sp. 19OD2882 TaxID=2794089 RepID=UPI001C1EA0E9|nr:hypothetical protein [Schaalia sp. 19OD2882]QWW20502.1 hypothetical protein I6B53_05415 [Schaalia sp. 19OD2882]
MMKELNTVISPPETVNVRDLVRDRQANNLRVDVLAEAVRPWFADWSGSREVAEAIDGLSSPERREAAARFLGLELVSVA